MNERDKKRACELIRSEYHSKRNLVAVEILPSEISAEADAIATREGMKADIAKLEKAKKVVHELQESLSSRAVALRGKHSEKRSRYSECSCGEPYQDVLEEIAKQSITEKRQSKKQIESLHAEERRLLAKIEIAETVEDIAKVMKSAGLV